MFDYSKLNGRVVEKCGTQAVFAEKMGISEATVSKKLNGNAIWNQMEIEKALLILDIPRNEISLYFFTKKLT